MNTKALRVGQRIRLKECSKNMLLNVVLKEPHVIDYGFEKFVVIFKYGVIVFWGLNDEEIRNFNEKIRDYVVEPLAVPQEENIKVQKGSKNSINDDIICLHKFDVQEVAIVSEVLSKSVALEFFESEMEKILTSFGEISTDLAKSGKTRYSSRAMLQKVGVAMNMEHDLVSQIATLDKPDLIWESTELDSFYNRLSEEYEITERYETLNQKLSMLFRDIELIMNYIDTKRSHLLELVIIALFLFEIIKSFMGSLF